MSEAPLEAYVRAVRASVTRGWPVERVTREVVRLNEDLIRGGFRMPPDYRTIAPDAPYTRNLIHQDPDHLFAVVAIVWGAFQETAVHDHLNWCVMAVLEESCYAIEYNRLDDERDPGFAELEIRSADILRPGTVVGLTPPPRTNIHKVASAGRATAITLHTYGDPGTRARIFDPATGSVEIRELEFHNQ